MKKILSLWMLLLVFSFSAQAAEKPIVFTSILPQKFLVEKIGGKRVQVEVLVPAGRKPRTYEPTPQQVIVLSKAKIWFSIGVSFEKVFIPKIKNNLKNLKIVDSAQGIKRRSLLVSKKTGKTRPDPHVWLSPTLGKAIAKNIYEALVEMDPKGKSVYSRGYQNVIKELNKVDKELQETFKPFKGSTFFVFHPAFGYLADDYGLKQMAIEHGGREATPAFLQEIIKKAKEQNVKIIFVQLAFSQKGAKKVAEAIDGAVVMLNPLSSDYVNNFRVISTEIKRAFQKQK